MSRGPVLGPYLPAPLLGGHERGVQPQEGHGLGPQVVGGHLFLPAVRLSKYIPADSKTGGGLGAARLDPFATGQVYNMSRSQQVHVLPPLNQHVEFVSLP
eukprot:GFUD01051619.1.p1 GENE.GFUD01051619.1~~GFUD01051619.1.p1  ORF type:complete len:100 (-),score=29.92 GFUD01051619.1:172-471(-)